MSNIYLTSQIAPLAANAGLQQNVTINSPTGYAFTNGAASAPASTGPGYATDNGSATGTFSGIFSSTWGTYLIFAAIAYFAWKKMR